MTPEQAKRIRDARTETLIEQLKAEFTQAVCNPNVACKVVTIWPENPNCSPVVMDVAAKAFKIWLIHNKWDVKHVSVSGTHKYHWIITLNSLDERPER